MNAHRSTWPVVTAVALLLATFDSGARADPEELTIGTAEGQQHPDFLLPSLDGGFLRLSDFRGKKLFLFHFASW